MTDSARAAHDLRALIFAPIGRDSALTCELLARHDIHCASCGTIAGLCDEL
jgi:hypothetical protein